MLHPGHPLCLECSLCVIAEHLVVMVFHELFHQNRCLCFSSSSGSLCCNLHCLAVFRRATFLNLTSYYA